MKINLIFDVPEENFEAAMAVYAGEAWSAISAALELIRAHHKYDARTAAETLVLIRERLSLAQERVL